MSLRQTGRFVVSERRDPELYMSLVPAPWAVEQEGQCRRAIRHVRRVGEQLGSEPNLFDLLAPRRKWAQMRRYLRLLEEAERATERLAALQWKE
jgi:hypothetical protein